MKNSLVTGGLSSSVESLIMADIPKTEINNPNTKNFDDTVEYTSNLKADLLADNFSLLPAPHRVLAARFEIFN